MLDVRMLYFGFNMYIWEQQWNRVVVYDSRYRVEMMRAESNLETLLLCMFPEQRIDVYVPVAFDWPPRALKKISVEKEIQNAVWITFRVL